jgi:hypothetical protein
MSIREDKSNASLDKISSELNEIEEEVAKITVPPSYGNDLYDLRHHVSLVREVISRARNGH